MQYSENGTLINTVPLSREILNHLIERKISYREFSILVYCIIKCDYKTGFFKSCSSIISREIGIPVETVKRCLRKLSMNKYLKTFVTRKNSVYPILVNYYPVYPVGSGKEVDICGTEDIKNIHYVYRNRRVQAEGPSSDLQEAPASDPVTRTSSTPKELQKVPAKTFGNRKNGRRTQVQSGAYRKAPASAAGTRASTVDEKLGGGLLFKEEEIKEKKNKKERRGGVDFCLQQKSTSAIKEVKIDDGDDWMLDTSDRPFFDDFEE